MLREIAERKRLAAIDMSNLRAFASALARVARALERHRKQEDREQQERDEEFAATCAHLDTIGEELEAAALAARELSDGLDPNLGTETSDDVLSFLRDTASISTKTLAEFRFV
jgi:post-segregation antitoxin (ccd killing protein)